MGVRSDETGAVTSSSGAALVSSDDVRERGDAGVTTRDRLIRVLVALGDEELRALGDLAPHGYLLIPCDDLAVFDRVAVAQGAEAVLLDAERVGALAAVTRLRRSDSALSTVPVLFVGEAGGALRGGFDAVDAGGDAFLPRPLGRREVLDRLRALLELPVGAASYSSPPPSLPAVPAVAAIAPLSSPPALALSTGAGIPAAPPPARVPGAYAMPALAREQEGTRYSSFPPPPNAPGASYGGAGGLTPAGLSANLAEVLRSAAARAGTGDVDLSLPSLEDDALDDLVPPELLEPLDAPLDGWGDEPSANTPAPGFGYGTWTSTGHAHTPPGFGPRRSQSRSFSAVNSSSRVGGPATPTITPLAIAGETRLTGSLGPYGVGALLGAASRARASGLLVLRAGGGEECALALTAGHVLALRSSRASDEIGPLLARLGAIPREAARFANTPLDAGLRGAAMLAARGYLSPTALAQGLSTAAREMVYDLLSLPSCEWEMRPLETAEEIPLHPRALDALVVLGARARIEPDEARVALGGDEATVHARAELPVLAALPLLAVERAAAEAATGQRVAELAAQRGATVLPAMLALAWLGLVRVEGGTGAVAQAPASALALERSRIRALVEAAEARDFFALLGVSAFASGAAARDALVARSAEVAGLCARHAEVRALPSVVAVLEEIGKMLTNPDAWHRYVSALRAVVPTNS